MSTRPAGAGTRLVRLSVHREVGARSFRLPEQPTSILRHHHLLPVALTTSLRFLLQLGKEISAPIMAEKMEGVESTDAEQPQVENVEQKTVAGTLRALHYFPTWLPLNALALIAHLLPKPAECVGTL